MQPVLLLWGADDPWIRPQSAERIRSLYPRAEKVLLPGVGHCPQVSLCPILSAEKDVSGVDGAARSSDGCDGSYQHYEDPAYEPAALGRVLVLQSGAATELLGRPLDLCDDTAVGKCVLGGGGHNRMLMCSLFHDSEMQLCSCAG